MLPFSLTILDVWEAIKAAGVHQDVNEDFQNAHDTTGTSRLLKLSQTPSFLEGQYLDVQID